MVAMVDVLERMDEQLYNEYRGIMAMLKQTIEDVHKFQDEETGMFWQVMDHPGGEGNYLETSGTALFAYAVLKGVRLGYLPKRMAAWAEKAFYGTCDKYLSKNPDGSLQLDGTYMAQPFYMDYETRYNKMQGCIDSYKQFMNIKKHMRDEKPGLYYHGYDESRQMYWADPVTGCSPNFWLRAMGWFMVAMVDVLERMDEQLYNEYRGIMAQLRQTIEDVHKFQDEETGMFWQVMDHPGVEGNYLETSGTALFAYAVLKGVRLGYLPKRMAAWAEKAFYGTCDRYLSKNPDGSLQLDGICLVAGLGGKDHRDGSLAYYFSEPVVCNDAKGVGPLVLAYTEMIARK